jgi:hypothetical protein
MTLFKIIYKSLISLIATPICLIAIFIAWNFGQPPAISVVWPAASGEVVGYKTIPNPNGTGDWTYPQITVEGGDAPYRLYIEGKDDAEKLKSEWPIGRVDRFQYSRKFKEVVWAGDQRRNLLFPLGFTLFSFGMMMWANAWLAPILLGPAGAVKAGLMVIGLGMMTIPPLVAYGFWVSGDPPATSVFWPSETFRTVSFEVDLPPDANDRTYVQPDIQLETLTGAGIKLSGIMGMTVKDVERLKSEFKVGAEVNLKRAPDGAVYQQKILKHWATFFATLMMPLFIYLGAVTFWRGLTTPIRGERNST